MRYNFQTLHDILDDILLNLYDRKQFTQNGLGAVMVEELYKDIKPKKIDLHHFVLLIEKLEKEGYIRYWKNIHSKDEKTRNMIHKMSINISINGILKIEGGGFSQPIKALRTEKYFQRTVGFFAILAGCYALLKLMYEFVLPLFSYEQNFCISCWLDFLGHWSEPF